MKKLLSLLLVITMVITPVSTFAAGKKATVTAYVTISQYGEFTETADGNLSVLLPVELTGKREYTLDDLFKEAHKLYYYGEDGYSSASGDYGAYITKFWGDESGNFGYQINGGEEAVMGLTHTVENGDYVDVAIYRNFYPDTEAYTKFDKYEETIFEGESTELMLYRAGYDENWNTVFSPCEGAMVTINGEETEFITDVDGKVNLFFEEAGTYIVSAYMEKTVGENLVPAMTAPVCAVTVYNPVYEISTRIAKKYSGTKITSDVNMVWLIADIAVYNELYIENQITFTSNVEQSCLDKIIAEADKSTAPSTLAKDIIALRAMGYDAKNVYNSKSQNIDIVQKLTELVDARDEAVTNVYTLPYVIIALRQGEDYATEDQMNYLIEYAISIKDLWQNNEWGTDAATAMLLALAPYYDTNENVKAAIDDTLPIITSAQTETGLIGNAASTGIAITALSALRIDPQEVICNENSIIDGLISQATENLDGFVPTENSFSTEQGFRGLLAWQLLSQGTGRIMYDFGAYPVKEAISTKKTSGGGSSSGGGGSGSYSPVEKEPENTKEDVKTEEKQEPVTEKPDTKNPDVKVMAITYPGKTFEDIKGHNNQREMEALAQRNIINGKTSATFEPQSTMTRAEFATIITRALGLLKNIPTAFGDVKPEDWYYTYINTAYSYGIVKGVSETEFNPNGLISRQEAAVMVARAAKLCGMETKMDKTAQRDVLSAFTDYIHIESWAEESVAFCFENGIVSDENSEILPAVKITRAEVALMVYNMLDNSSLLLEDVK